MTIVNYPTHWSTSTIKPIAAKCGKIKFLEKSGPELKVIFEERSEAFQFFDKLRTETFKGQLLIPLYPADKIWSFVPTNYTNFYITIVIYKNITILELTVSWNIMVVTINESILIKAHRGHRRYKNSNPDVHFLYSILNKSIFFIHFENM